MKTPALIVVSVLIFALAGCVHLPADLGASQQNREAEATGWPFRWKIRSIPGGTAMTHVMIDLPSGPTKADARLKQDILNKIGEAKYYQHGHPAILEDVRLMPDGQEVWILKDPSKTIGRGYVVTLKGGGKFSVSGLNAFQKGA